MCCSKHVEPSINFGIINYITNLHLVVISTEIHSYVQHLLSDLSENCYQKTARNALEQE
jgi:hypothetical protein